MITLSNNVEEFWEDDTPIFFLNDNKDTYGIHED